MRDFDDFLAKKLEEESSFPNREKNWQRLAGRLPKGGAPLPNGGGQSLGLWKLAALAALAGTGVLSWFYVQLRQENAALKTAVTALEQRTAPRASAEDLPKTHTVISDNPTMSNDQGATPSTPDGSEKYQLPGKVFKDFSPDLPQSDWLYPTATGNTMPNADKTGLKADTASSIGTFSTAAIEHDTTRREKSVALAQPPADTNSTIGATQAATSPATMPGDSTSVGTSVPDSLSAQKVAASKSDSLTSRIDTSATAQSPAIKPVRTTPERLRAGIQAQVGFVRPPMSGVKRMSGQGISIQTRLVSGLWVGGSLNLVRFDEKSTYFEDRLHGAHCFPQPPFGGGGPGPGPWDWDLKEVRSTQQHTRLGLGLELNAPWRFFLRPAVRFSHEWVRVAPSTLVFQFEDRHHHGNVDTEYSIKDTDAYWLKNQWKLGVGMQVSVRRWSLNLWLDYARDAAKSPTGFDALYTSAGVQYNFGGLRNPVSTTAVQ